MSSPSTGVNDNQYEDTYRELTAVQCDYAYDNMAVHNFQVMFPSEMIPQVGLSFFPASLGPFPPLAPVH